MKRMTFALAALSAASMFAINANAQETEAPTGLTQNTEGLQEWVVRPHSRFPGSILTTDRFRARLDGNTFPSLNLFSNDLHSTEYVLSKASEIELTADQRRRIIDIEAESQARLTRKRLENEGSDSRLDSLLAEHPIDADAALAELDRLLETERGPKREQLATMIAVRNVLTKAQVDALADLRQPIRIQFLERAEFFEEPDLDLDE